MKVESARRAIKRIRLDSEQLRTAPSSPAHDIDRPASPVKPLRLAARNTPIVGLCWLFFRLTPKSDVLCVDQRSSGTNG